MGVADGHRDKDRKKQNQEEPLLILLAAFQDSLEECVKDLAKDKPVDQVRGKNLAT